MVLSHQLDAFVFYSCSCIRSHTGSPRTTQPYLIQIPAQVTSSPSSSPSPIQEVEWVTATDPSSGAVFYWNKVTNETTWEIPPKKITHQACVYPSTKPESPMLLSMRSKADTLKKTHGASGLLTDVSKRSPCSVTTAGKHQKMVISWCFRNGVYLLLIILPCILHPRR